MSCAGCVADVENTLKAVPGVDTAVGMVIAELERVNHPAKKWIGGILREARV